MDPRVKAAAIASFITSFKTLMPCYGPQYAEQTLPRFIASALDFADSVELAAPRRSRSSRSKPISSRSPAPRTRSRSEALLRLFRAATPWLIHGQNGHCNLGPVSPQVFAFLTTHLKGAGAPVATFTPARAKNPDALTVTGDGQVSLALGSLTVEELAVDARCRSCRQPHRWRPPRRWTRLRSRIQRDVRALASVTAMPGAASKVTTVPKATADGFRTETVTLESESGVTLDAVLAVPDQDGAHPAILWMDAAPIDDIAASADFARLAKAGRVVLALHPRGVLGEPPPNPSQLALGPYMALFQRAVAVGRTIVGLRVDDTIRAIDWLASRPDVDQSAITVYGTGAQGMVALHAAALDPRIRASSWSAGWCRIGRRSRPGCTRTCPRCSFRPC